MSSSPATRGSRDFHSLATRADARARFTVREATAQWRMLPDFVIIGAMRGGTTSLYRWLCGHPEVAAPFKYVKEVHYFDRYYLRRDLRWYRAHFPLALRGKHTGESSAHMLFNPVSPGRAAGDLPSSSLFIALLRDPVQRALSHYWHNRRLGLWESESFGRAIELEPERLARTAPAVAAGEWSVEHMAFSYASRGDYAPQLARWFDAVGRDRVYVCESERLYAGGSAPGEILEWLGLSPTDEPYPQLYSADRETEADPALLASLEERFAPAKRELFELLGRELWVER